MKQSYRTEAEPQLFLRNLPFFYFWVFKVSSVARYSVSLFVCAFIFVNKKKNKKVFWIDPRRKYLSTTGHVI